MLPFANLTADTSQLNFGVQVNENQVVPGCFSITNSGYLDGNFSLQTPLPSYLSISLSNGTLKPKQSQKIEIRILCKQVGAIDEYVR